MKCVIYITPEGIARGNDPYLYGEKLKAYLINGARNLGTFNPAGQSNTGEPNEVTGWGALCVSRSLP